jgi:putative membrane protein
MHSFIRFIVASISVVLTVYLLPGVELDHWSTAVFLAAILGLLNIFLKPILVIFTLPITVFTLGIFLIIINGLIVIIADRIIPGFKVDSFGWAIAFSLVLSILESMLESMLGIKKVKVKHFKNKYYNETEDQF